MVPVSALASKQPESREAHDRICAELAVAADPAKVVKLKVTSSDPIGGPGNWDRYFDTTSATIPNRKIFIFPCSPARPIAISLQVRYARYSSRNL